mmetsp:Transcript_9619/g.34234  ORF Transcript_9619/g.34234 Transcript_9619/m.34234 type:complete len:422 (+) Transcript_9619:155-1420(+)
MMHRQCRRHCGQQHRFAKALWTSLQMSRLSSLSTCPCAPRADGKGESRCHLPPAPRRGRERRLEGARRLAGHGVGQRRRVGQPDAALRGRHAVEERLDHRLHCGKRALLRPRPRVLVAVECLQPGLHGPWKCPHIRWLRGRGAAAGAGASGGAVLRHRRVRLPRGGCSHGRGGGVGGGQAEGRRAHACGGASAHQVLPNGLDPCRASALLLLHRRQGGDGPRVLGAFPGVEEGELAVIQIPTVLHVQSAEQPARVAAEAKHATSLPELGPGDVVRAIHIEHREGGLHTSELLVAPIPEGDEDLAGYGVDGSKSDVAGLDAVKLSPSAGHVAVETDFVYRIGEFEPIATVATINVQQLTPRAEPVLVPRKQQVLHCLCCLRVPLRQQKKGAASSGPRRRCPRAPTPSCHPCLSHGRGPSWAP